VAVNTNSKQVVLTFTEEAIEKQTPLHFKVEPPQPDVWQHAGKVARGILNVIAKPKTPEGEQPGPDAKTPPPAEQPPEKQPEKKE
jgi:hypothetical protein